MAKKTHVKVRLVPEAKPDSSFFYYVKKPAGGEKAKVKLSAKKYNPDTSHIISAQHPISSQPQPNLAVNNYEHGLGHAEGGSKSQTLPDL